MNDLGRESATVANVANAALDAKLRIDGRNIPVFKEPEGRRSVKSLRRWVIMDTVLTKVLMIRGSKPNGKAVVC